MSVFSHCCACNTLASTNVAICPNCLEPMQVVTERVANRSHPAPTQSTLCLDTGAVQVTVSAMRQIQIVRVFATGDVYVVWQGKVISKNETQTVFGTAVNSLVDTPKEWYLEPNLYLAFSNWKPL